MTLVWENQPGALTEIFGGKFNRAKLDLTNVLDARLSVWVVVAGAATAKLRAQYSLDGSSWAYLDGVAGPSAAISAVSADTPAVSPWVSLAAAAKADVYVRIVGIDGDSAADPEFGQIQLQVR